MLSASSNRLGISYSPHSVSNKGTVTTPSWGDTNPFVIAQKEALSRGMGDLGESLASFFDLTSFNWQTVALMGMGGYLVYRSFFSEEGKKIRGKRLLKREARKHTDRVARLEKRYGVRE